MSSDGELPDHVSGSHCVEAFVTDAEMEKMEYPAEDLHGFLLPLGPEEFFKNKLSGLRERLHEEYGYKFDVAKLAEALTHLRGIDGFLNRGVLSDAADDPGLAIEIQYREEMYPLRVRISDGGASGNGGWYVLAPQHDPEGGRYE